MKYIFYIILLSIITTSCSQKKIILTEEQLPTDVYYQDDELKPFEGICLIYFEGTENIKEEMSFKNGVLNGSHTSYFKNGNIKRKGYYEDGYLDGTWLIFNEAGTRVYEVEYQSDTLSGLFRAWYPSGVPRTFGTYSENKKTGSWIYYNEAGMITKKENL